MIGRRLLTTREVAELLGVSPETVLRWQRRGELPGFRLPGGVLRFDADEIDRWLEARRDGSAPAPAVRLTVLGTLPDDAD